MRIRKLYQVSSRGADFVLAAELLLFGGALILAIHEEQMLLALILALFILAVCGWRYWKGPMAGPSIVEISESTLKFNDSDFAGKGEFSLDQVRAISIVGPRSSRRVRVQTDSGDTIDAFHGLRGRRLQRVEAFLRENLPRHIRFIDDETPGLMAVLRDDF